MAASKGILYATTFPFPTPESTEELAKRMQALGPSPWVQLSQQWTAAGPVPGQENALSPSSPKLGQ